MTQYDAVLLVSFGGPEASDQVMPFLEAVTAGRGIPQERLVEVAAQYEAFGGKSPINEQNKLLRTALEQVLNDRPGEVNYQRVYWGNRNWEPYLVDALRQMRDDGVKRAACIVTSGYSSYSGCRQYRENLFDAVAAVPQDGGGLAPELDKIRRWFDQPEFVDVMAENTRLAMSQLTGASTPHLVFTTHSLPIGMAEASGDPAQGGDMYVRQHTFVAEQIAATLSVDRPESLNWDLVYQSRSGPPSMPWLVPDVNDHLRQLGADGVEAVVVVPIGFVSDHMEVKWDLDTVVVQTCDELGIEMARAATVGTDPRFVQALARLVREREDALPDLDRITCAPWGPAPDLCPVGCCPNPRHQRPALFGAGSLDD